MRIPCLWEKLNIDKNKYSTKNDGINTLSCFDGISCGRVAAERAGLPIKKYFASEIEPHAEGVSKYNYPDIVRLGDINNYETWDLPKIDLLIGGSPCQDLSIAKANRTGLKGSRSGLFFKYVDCLERFTPKYFLLENNASMKKEDKDTISEILGVEPIMINSEFVSAQSRKRLYWTNIPGVEQPEDKGILLKDIILSGKVDRNKSLCLARRYAGFSGSQSYMCRRYFGKSFGQPVFEGDIEAIRKMWKENPYFESDERNIRQMYHIECERLQTLPDDYTKYEISGDVVKETPTGIRYEMIGNAWTCDVIAHIFTYLKKDLEK